METLQGTVHAIEQEPELGQCKFRARNTWLAACVTTSMVAHAAVRGIHIEELESELEGDIDLRGFLGLSNDVPKGFTEIRVKFKVKADVDNMERLKRLAAYSPVFNTITQGANVYIQVEPK